MCTGPKRASGRAYSYGVRSTVHQLKGSFRASIVICPPSYDRRTSELPIMKGSFHSKFCDAWMSLTLHDDWAPLSWAAESKHAAMTPLLREKSVGIECKNLWAGCTLLLRVETTVYETTTSIPIYRTNCGQNMPSAIVRGPESRIWLQEVHRSA